MKTMKIIIFVVSLLFILKGINGDDHFDWFLGDLIHEWNLRSPTIVVNDHLPDMCRTSYWILCLHSSMDTTELAGHITNVDRGNKQDSLIFGPGQDHQLFDDIEQVKPLMFRLNTPVFMPLEYSDMIELKLDSNILFYEEEEPGTYKLLDKFAVKGGPPIVIELGKWDFSYGMRLKSHKNRWDRRTDLRGAEIVNSLATYGPWSILLKDADGNVVGSQGELQHLIFYIADRLNLSIRTIEMIQEPWKKLENGSWTGGIGELQRKESDICSNGMGILHERSFAIDFPLPVIYDPITLFALKPTGIAPNMWVYVRVFGVIQWVIFMMLLIAFAMVMTMMLLWRREQWQDTQMKYVPTAFGTSFLFTIQMGEHPDTNHFGTRILTLTTSMLTLLLWVYYTNDITAEMTSGPPGIPVNTFEDVLHHDYRVVAWSTYLIDLLHGSEPGTAKHDAYNLHFSNGDETKDNADSILEMISDPESKTLFYAQRIAVTPRSDYEKFLMDKIYPLKMDDAFYNLIGLGLQKDSEFLGIFNHYLLKEMEHGINMREIRSLQNLFHRNKQFEMAEPQPLGNNNVMFLFILLGLGITLSMTMTIVEVAVGKCMKYSSSFPPKCDQVAEGGGMAKIKQDEVYSTYGLRPTRSLNNGIGGLIKKQLF